MRRRVPPATEALLSEAEMLTKRLAKLIAEVRTTIETDNEEDGGDG